MNQHAIDRRGTTLLIVLTAVFIVLAVAVGWVWWRKAPAQPNVEEGRAVAEHFLESLRKNQAAGAWERTTAEFKSAEGCESFVAFVKKHPELTKPVTFVAVQTVTVGNSPRAEYVYRSADGKATVRLLAGNEQGTWRIDRMRVE